MARRPAERQGLHPSRHQSRHFSHRARRRRRGKITGKPLDGVNLVPFLTGKESARPHQTLFWKNGAKWAVRAGDLKLTAGNNEGRKAAGRSEPAPAVFDLTADQGESTDLAAKRPEDIARLTKLYEDWKRDFPKPTWGGGAKEEAE